MSAYGGLLRQPPVLFIVHCSKKPQIKCTVTVLAIGVLLWYTWGMNTVSKPKGEGKSPVRTRHWVCVLYPESLPDNWRDILDDLHVPYVLSPLHDKDINADGTPKKEHYHCVLVYQGLKSFWQVKEVTDRLNAPIPQVCHNLVGQIRYFIHKDNPEKAQYNSFDIEDHSMGQVDVVQALMSKAEELELSKELFKFIFENCIVEFTELVNYCITEHADWYYYLISGHSWIYLEYIKSLRHGGRNYGRQAREGEGSTAEPAGCEVCTDTRDIPDSAEHQEDGTPSACEHIAGSECTVSWES